MHAAPSATGARRAVLDRCAASRPRRMRDAWDARRPSRTDAIARRRYRCAMRRPMIAALCATDARRAVRD